MALPVIGITTSRELNKNGHPVIYLMEAYVQAVAQAGGAPLLIPLGIPAEQLEAILPRLDGLVFSGGGDVHPDQYGSTEHPALSGVDPDRDRIELILARRITQDERPFLGICRGIQLLNIALGGTLFEDLEDQHPNHQKHQFSPGQPRNYLAHPVQVSEGSLLHTILAAESAQVNSLHHQGLRQVAPGLQTSAYSPDGVVEAVELVGHPFGLAVQWHPEWLQEHAPMRQIFKAFVTAAQSRAGSR